MDFETRLKRARVHNRPQYLRIKALALLDSPSSGFHRAGMGLLRRVIEEFPDDRLQVAFAHERLGDEQGRLGQSRIAIDEYRRSIAINPGGSGTTGMVRVKLAELLASEGSVSEAKSEFEQAELDSASERLIFPANEFEFQRVGVEIAHADEDAESAQAHARAALEAASSTRSGAAKHPTLGLVSADPVILEQLRRVAQLPKQKRGWLRRV
jgi:tetratricopeptide (TPR) repeat protein